MDDDDYTQEVARELQAREQEERAFIVARMIQRLYNQMTDEEFVAVMSLSGSTMEDIQ